VDLSSALTGWKGGWNLHLPVWLLSTESSADVHGSIFDEEQIEKCAKLDNYF
jgi:hypothetical protein